VALLVPGLFTSYPLTALLRVFLGVWVIVALGMVPSAWFLSLKVRTCYPPSVCNLICRCL
jgi:hypothetical protein